MPRTHTKRPLYKVSPSFTYSLIFLNKIFFLFLESAYPSSPIVCEEIRVMGLLNPRPTKQTIKRKKNMLNFSMIQKCLFCCSQIAHFKFPVCIARAWSLKSK